MSMPPRSSRKLVASARRLAASAVFALGTLPCSAAAMQSSPDRNAPAVTPAQHQIDDLQTLKTKFVALARAFGSDQMNWRPMEGVRSVHEVVALMVAEVHLFPTIWGAAPPEASESGWEPEMARTTALPPDAAIEQMEAGFDHMIASVESLDAASRAATVDWFGTPMQAEAALSAALFDMHEHLGQLIAYARMNRVVPPWSR